MSSTVVALARYLEAILGNPQARPEVRAVAAFVTSTRSDTQCIAYLERVMSQNAERSRVYEVASELVMFLKEVEA